MRVTFLGTGTSGGVPMIGCQCPVCQSADPKDNRLRSSILVQTDQTAFTIDCGTDFRQQMLREKVLELDAIVFTHAHKDHTGGLDDVRAYNFLLKRDMEIYLDELTESILRNQYDYIFAPNPYPGIPRLNLNRIHKDSIFSIGDVELQTLLVMHHKMPVLAFRMGDFTYITDASYVADEEVEKIKGTKTLVINGVRRDKHIAHFNIDQALEFIERVQPEQAYITHISHQLGRYADVNPTLPEGVQLAYDGLKLDINE